MSSRNEFANDSQASRNEVVNESQAVATVVANGEPIEGAPPLYERDRTTGRYTNIQIAEDLGASESSVRYWFAKVREVCPMEWLKVDGKHTDLSAGLLADYAARVARGPMAAAPWVLEMQEQFETPPKTDVLPADTALALRSNEVTATALTEYLGELGSEVLEATQKVDAYMDDLEASDMELLQTELEAVRKRGAKRAVLKYAAEKQAENETAQALRQREIERRRGAQS